MNELLKIVVVEDEPISSAYLKKLIADTGIPHEILVELDSVAEGMEFFGTQPNYDLIFMDIHLGDGTCFELLNEATIDKPIIFCTTFDSYAVEAFKYNSIDYLIKPVNATDLNNALNKYRNQNQINYEQLQQMQNLMKSLQIQEYKKRFLIRTKEQHTIMDINNVICFYSEDGHSYLVDTCGQSHQIDFILERLEALVNPNDFFRINRKVMVAIDHIHAVKDYSNNRLEIKLSEDLPIEMVVSRNRVKQFKIWLKGLT